jgi:predicted transcriptional regulator
MSGALESLEKKEEAMKVKEVMMGTPYFCQYDSNLGIATELMWKANCGFLPVKGREGRICGVLTDRDVCIALGTRNKVAGEVTAEEVMNGKLYSCMADDDIHVALQAMKEGKVRRLAVIAKDGSLEGVISMDDILLRAEPSSLGREPELSSEEVVRTYRAINERPVPQIARRAAA